MHLLFAVLHVLGQTLLKREIIGAIPAPVDINGPAGFNIRLAFGSLFDRQADFSIIVYRNYFDFDLLIFLQMCF